MADFNDFLTALSANIKDFAVENWEEYKAAIISDGNEFAKKIKENLRKATEKLVAGMITKEEFEWLIKGMRDLAEMEALKQLGLTQVQVDKCRAGIIDIVVKTVFKFFL